MLVLPTITNVALKRFNTNQHAWAWRSKDQLSTCNLPGTLGLGCKNAFSGSGMAFLRIFHISRYRLLHHWTLDLPPQLPSRTASALAARAPVCKVDLGLSEQKKPLHGSDSDFFVLTQDQNCLLLLRTLHLPLQDPSSSKHSTRQAPL
jgi:hypothetical protein